MRQAIWGLLLIVLIFAIGACERQNGQNVQRTAKGETSHIVAVLLAPSGKGDNSYNDTVLAGLRNASVARSISVREILPARAEDYPDIVRGLARDGVALVIGVGSQYGDTFRKLAAKLQSTKFLLLDAHVGSLPNVRSVIFKHDEGSYLVGVAAAAMSASGWVGFVGGMDIPVTRTFACGYRNGVTLAAAMLTRQIVVREVYIGNTPDAFANPGKGEEIATSMTNSGIDVIYHAAGASGNGVIKAVEKAGKFAIGVDTDQSYLAPKVVITSMRKRLDTAVEVAISDMVQGTFTGGIVEMSLANKGVDIVTPGLLSKEASDMVSDARGKLTRRELKACPS